MIKSHIITCLAFSALLLFAAPFVAFHIPTFHFLNDLARIIEGPALHFTIAGFCIGVFILIIGAYKRGLLIIVLSFGMLFYIFSIANRPELQPFDDGKVITLLTINIEAGDGDVELLVQNMLAANADILILLEATAQVRQRIIASNQYPYELDCTGRCDVVGFSKYQVTRSARHDLANIWNAPRYGEMAVKIDERTSATIAIAHLTKAWVPQSIFEPRQLHQHLKSITGPLIIAGDFNAAPWNLRVRQIAKKNGLYFRALPPATWPVRAKQFGIPIDHVGARGGVNILSLEGWDGAIHSNHRGLLAEIKIRSK